jgi:large subunit ribosomal protein L24e
MVIKTESCSFSEFKIYPGTGARYFAKDGRSFNFLSKKVAKLALRKVKA